MTEDHFLLEIFAGAGGLSEGFIREGFNPVCLVDSDGHACNTLKTRLTYWWLKKNDGFKIYLEYVKGNISREDLYSQIDLSLDDIVLNTLISKESIHDISSRMKKNVEKKDVKNIDVLLGSPPCQAYSAVGKARLSLNKAEGDPRIYLYKYFIEMVKKFKPKFFVFENVPSIKTTLNGEIFNSMTRKLEKMHYKVEPQVLNSKEYFVLQSRKRMILVGWSKDIDGEYPLPDKKEHNFFVSDLLNDLPSLKPGEGKNVMDYDGPPNDYLKDSGIRDDWNILTHHIARPHNKRDIMIYKKAINAWRKASERLKYTDLPKELQTHKNKKSFLDRFKVVADNKQQSHTIVAHIAKDGHYYIHPDFRQSRSLTVREAARIQSFPDDYYFEGPRTARYRQVGNAVPPLLAQGIAQKIGEMLN